VAVACLCGAAAQAHAVHAAQAAQRLKHEERVFRRSLRDLPPLALSRSEIREALRKKAAVDKVLRSGDTKLSYGFLPVDTSPGARAPVLTLSPGTALAITFTDSTGAPWAVTSRTIGNPKLFSVAQPKGLNDNMLVVSPLTPAGSTNLIVTLAGRTAPVALAVRVRPDDHADLPAVLDVSVPGTGPLARIPTIEAAGPATISSAQIAFLEGVPPAGARTLTAHPVGPVSAWLYKGRVYLRTRASLIFPAWRSVVRGSGHLRVYTVAPVPQVLVARHGHTVSIALTGEDTHG
jgi:intracellular multiplication protein IcmK